MAGASVDLRQIRRRISQQNAAPLHSAPLYTAAPPCNQPVPELGPSVRPQVWGTGAQGAEIHGLLGLWVAIHRINTVLFPAASCGGWAGARHVLVLFPAKWLV